MCIVVVSVLRQNAQSAWINLLLERMPINFRLFLDAKCYYYLKVTMNCVYVVKLMVAKACHFC